jgi:hypothetical protein
VQCRLSLAGLSRDVFFETHALQVFSKKRRKEEIGNTDCDQTFAQFCVSPGRVFSESGGGV